MYLINQINIDLGILKITDGLHLAEAIIIGIIIIIQIQQTIRTLRKIKVLEKAFKTGIRLEQGWFDEKEYKSSGSLTSGIHSDEEIISSTGNYKKITIVKANGHDSIIHRIAEAINHYLIRNYGAVVNFGIIKDIIEREVDNYDEEITQSIPTPLYLGLGATMLGIIFGLLAIPVISATDGGGETLAFMGIINPLIDGVKIAMIASVVGLLLTTVLSSFKYKSARLSILNNKNRMLTYLETELLPELYETEGSGVSGLKYSLDQFSRKAEEIVSRVDETVQKTYTNIQVQLDLVGRVEQMDINKIARLNLEVFKHLERNMKALAGFSDYLASIEKISGNLDQFASRTTSIDKIADQIHETLADSGRLTRFLTQHFEEMETLGDNARKAVSAAGGITIDAFNLAESHFKNAIESLEKEIDNRIQVLNTRVNLEESQLNEKYAQFRAEMHQLTSLHLESFRKAYSDAVPNFDQLEKLRELEPIRNILDNNTQNLKDVIVENNDKLNDNLSRLNANLESILSQDNNARLLQELVDIQKKSGNNGRTKSVRPKREYKPVKSFLGMFKWKRRNK
jgi:phage shock protein A